MPILRQPYGKQEKPNEQLSKIWFKIIFDKVKNICFFETELYVTENPSSTSQKNCGKSVSKVATFSESFRKSLNAKKLLFRAVISYENGVVLFDQTKVSEKKTFEPKKGEKSSTIIKKTHQVHRIKN